MTHPIMQSLTRNNLALVLLFLIFWAPIIVFLKIAGEVIEKEPIPFDTAIIQWLHAHANSFLDIFFLISTNIGGVLGIVSISIILVGYLLYKSQRRNALLLIAGVGGASVANLILKALFQRDRPSLFSSSVVETSFSFPSGHAMASSALALCLVLIFWNTRWRWLATPIALLFVLAIGLSRLYFGVHYPSDIVAGWCVSAAWVMIVFFVVRKLHLQLKTSHEEI